MNGNYMYTNCYQMTFKGKLVWQKCGKFHRRIFYFLPQIVLQHFSRISTFKFFGGRMLFFRHGRGSRGRSKMKDWNKDFLKLFWKLSHIVKTFYNVWKHQLVNLWKKFWKNKNHFLHGNQQHPGNRTRNRQDYVWRL